MTIAKFDSIAALPDEAYRQFALALQAMLIETHPEARGGTVNAASRAAAHSPDVFADIKATSDVAYSRAA